MNDQARHLAAGRPITRDPGGGSARGGTRALPVERWNRILLWALGLLLLGAGVTTLLAGWGVFGASFADQPPLSPDVRSFAARHGWFWPALGIAAGLLALGSLAWLAAQPRSGRPRGLYIVDDAIGGVRLDTGALTAAVAADLVDNPAVRAARVAVRGRPRHLSLRMTVETDADADIRSVRADVDGRVLPRLQHAVGRPDLAAELEIEAYAGAPARARARAR